MPVLPPDTPHRRLAENGLTSHHPPVGHLKWLFRVYLVWDLAKVKATASGQHLCLGGARRPSTYHKMDFVV